MGEVTRLGCKKRTEPSDAVWRVPVAVVFTCLTFIIIIIIIIFIIIIIIIIIIMFVIIVIIIITIIIFRFATSDQSQTYS